jgi:DNA-binding transcriptional MerR regulator
MEYLSEFALYFYDMEEGLQQFTFEFNAEDVPKKEAAVVKPVATVKEKAPGRGRKSLREMGEDAEQLDIPPDEHLFQKQYYSIGEVAQMFRVNGSLLRYWESEFSMSLRKNRKGDRFFKPADIKTLLLIYDLLRRRKFTIEGAKEYLKENKKADEKYELIQSLQKMKSFLLELKAHL